MFLHILGLNYSFLLFSMGRITIYMKLSKETAMDSFQNTKLIFENWKRFAESKKSKPLLSETATQDDLDQAIVRIQATGWKGGHSANDEALLMALFKPLEGADSKPTVGALKALIKILAIEIQSKGGFISKIMEGGVGDAWGKSMEKAKTS